MIFYIWTNQYFQILDIYFLKYFQSSPIQLERSLIELEKSPIE